MKVFFAGFTQKCCLHLKNNKVEAARGWRKYINGKAEVDFIIA